MRLSPARRVQVPTWEVFPEMFSEEKESEREERDREKEKERRERGRKQKQEQKKTSKKKKLKHERNRIFKKYSRGLWPQTHSFSATKYWASSTSPSGSKNDAKVWLPLLWQFCHVIRMIDQDKHNAELWKLQIPSLTTGAQVARDYIFLIRPIIREKKSCSRDYPPPRLKEYIFRSRHPNSLPFSLVCKLWPENRLLQQTSPFWWYTKENTKSKTTSGEDRTHANKVDQNLSLAP